MDTKRNISQLLEKSKILIVGAAVLFLILFLLPILIIINLLNLLLNEVKRPITYLSKILFNKFVELIYPTSLGSIHLKILSKKNKKRLHRRMKMVKINSTLHVHVIPQFSDNYCYVVVELPENSSINLKKDKLSKKNKKLSCIIVDCGDGETVECAINMIKNIYYQDTDLKPIAIFSTHHHWDHMGGNEYMCNKYDSISHVFGGANEKVYGKNFSLKDLDCIKIFKEANIVAFHTPGHTCNSYTYAIHSKKKNNFPVIFTGDSLMIGGSGAAFECSHRELITSIIKFFFLFEKDTYVFPGHEYSCTLIKNLIDTRLESIIYNNNESLQKLIENYTRFCHLNNLQNPIPAVPVKLYDEILYNPCFESFKSLVRIIFVAILYPMNERTVAFETEVSKINTNLVYSRNPDPNLTHVNLEIVQHHDCYQDFYDLDIPCVEIMENTQESLDSVSNSHTCERNSEKTPQNIDLGYKIFIQNLPMISKSVISSLLNLLSLDLKCQKYIPIIHIKKILDNANLFSFIQLTEIENLTIDSYFVDMLEPNDELDCKVIPYSKLFNFLSNRLCFHESKSSLIQKQKFLSKNMGTKCDICNLASIKLEELTIFVSTLSNVSPTYCIKNLNSAFF